MGQIIVAIRRLLSWLSGWVAVVALAVVLHDQFRGYEPGWEATVLMYAVLAWWVSTIPLEVVLDLRDDPQARQRRGQIVSLALYVIAWAVRGATLVKSVAVYVDSTAQEPAFTLALAMLAGAMVVLTLVQRAALSWAGGQAAPAALRGLRAVFTVVRWIGYVALAGFALVVGELVATAVFWIPVEVYVWFDGWAWWWAAIIGGTIVSLAYFSLLGRATGVLQVFYGERFSVVRTQQYGSHVNEFYEDFGYDVPRPRSGLRALVRMHWIDDETTNSMTTGSGSGTFSGGYGYFSSQSYTHSTTYGRVHLIEFPPEHLPGWISALLSGAGR